MVYVVKKQKMSVENRILFPLPNYGFDPTETAVPWKRIKAAGFTVVFSTPTAKQPKADNRVLTGEGFGLLKPFCMADKEALAAYAEMENSEEFRHPIAYDAIKPDDYVGIVIAGGHDKGMREYLESTTLQTNIVNFFHNNKPVGAICHGCLLVGRSRDPATGKSVLFGKKMTALTRRHELSAYNMTRLFLGDYYLTYPETTVEDEMRGYAEKAEDFQVGPGWPIPTLRDSAVKPYGFALIDGNYVSSRFFGDANAFANAFIYLLTQKDEIKQ
ncbi:uncharacterized protein LOC129587885 [Paramacrobiotus metropolitanus]|uniref:uncharacterized protein LOC129587885 n=1 Tax=Paramacrobiotus metropolitanus TaxID=2943436 RepID=UPI00244635EE|nr:uncharacterized protein LOC129587885 [Paramacrobiotus metropolitanus]